jgi:hypothetical protein
MRHLDDGALRRLYDDPLAVGEPDRAHFAACDECSRRFDAVAADARRAAALLAVPEATVDSDAALARLRSRTEPAPVLRMPHRLPWRPVAAAGIAAAAAVALAVTGAAQQLMTVMQPTNVTVVPVTMSELQAMPDLYQFGSVNWSGNPNLTQVADAAAASSAAGFSAPAVNPAGASVPGRISYGVLGRSTATFTFSAAKAQAWADAHHVTLPAMPGGLDGSSIEVTFGPGIVEMYGGFSPAENSVPKLAVGKMTAPTLSSTGPSVREIEDYLTSIPGFPPGLAAQLKALGDPSTTLPLPVPVDRATAEKADVNGVTATVVGDNTGLGAGAIWVSGGYVYGVAGTQSQDTILSIARSLR